MRIMILGSLMAIMFLDSALAQTNPVIWWKFDKDKGRAAIDSMSRTEDVISGNYKYTNGAKGNAIKFDGYTTSVIRKATQAPRLADTFTVETRVALQAYPWNWTAIVNQEKDHKAGYFFGIDAEGHIGLNVSVNGQWRECISKSKLLLLKWSHIAGTFDKDRGINIYINGKPAGSLATKGKMTPAEGLDLLLGKSHTKMYPKNTEREPSRKQLSNMVFDGLIDEVKIYSRALSAEEMSQSFAAVRLKKKQQPLNWRVMPSGPEGTGKFGAFYTNLKYCDEWDSLWRGSGLDVVVRFEQAPIRLVSWRGISYNPCWVTENGNWFSNEFMERSAPMG
ncbi:MAG: LamG domain-containing protein, partial [Planctomycetota bacterium]